MSYAIRQGPSPPAPAATPVPAGTPGPQVSLADWTTLRVGGPAKTFVEVVDVASLASALRAAEGVGDPVLVLGGGSNVVVPDDGFGGTVLHMAMKGVRVEPEPSYPPAPVGTPNAKTSSGWVVAQVAAGEDWSAFVAYCVAEGLSGVECLSGIPGLAGATPVQNVGAYGQEVSQTIASVTVWDRQARALTHMAPPECRFSYRDSVFKRNQRYIVTEVAFRLRRSQSSDPVRYEELARRLGVERGQTAPLDVTAQAVLELRRAKGMVLDASDPDSRSVGSFFTNPVLDEAGLRALLVVAPDVPRFAAEGGTKVAAAWLVEHAGFTRGYRNSGAAISTKHALAITALEGGTAADVLALARDVRDGVTERFGVQLEAEPVLVGGHL